jgi:hypothetical protein
MAIERRTNPPTPDWLANHNEKWSQLTCVPGFGPGGVNSFRTLPWLYSAGDQGDSRLASLKQQHRDVIQLMATVFVRYLVLLPVLLFWERTAGSHALAAAYTGRDSG